SLRRSWRAPARCGRDALVEVDADGVASLLSDRGAHAGGDGELVGAVAEGHERAAERVAVDAAPDADQATGAEVPGRAGHHEVGPAALARALLQHGREVLVQGGHRGPPYISEPGDHGPPWT